VIVLLIASLVLGHGIVFMILAVPVGVALLWATLAIGAKRQHDRNLSGQFVLILFIALLASFVLGSFTPPGLAGKILGWALSGARLAMAGYLFVMLFCLHGTRGGNDYGSDPIIPELDPNDPSYVPAGYSVKVAGAGSQQEFFYVAEADRERARAIIREASGAPDDSVTIMGAILYQTVAKLGLRQGEFVTAPRLQS
jgi:uncharacterized membrane protein YhaH (DUF805 family)